MTPEGKLKDQVKKYLDSLGAYYFMPVQMGYGSTAVDFLCCVKGRFVAIETKVKPRKPTKLQDKFLKEVRSAYGISIVAYNLEDIVEVLERNGIT